MLHLTKRNQTILLSVQRMFLRLAYQQQMTYELKYRAQGVEGLCVCLCVVIPFEHILHKACDCSTRDEKKKCERVLSEPCFTAFDAMNSQLYYWSLARNSTSFCMEPQKASSVYFVIHCLRVRFCRAFGITRLLITQSCNTYNPLET